MVVVLTVCTQPSFSVDLLVGSDAGGCDPYLREPRYPGDPTNLGCDLYLGDTGSGMLSVSAPALYVTALRSPAATNPPIVSVMGMRLKRRSSLLRALS